VCGGCSGVTLIPAAGLGLGLDTGSGRLDCISLGKKGAVWLHLHH
jgi:hypothetical protein